MQGYHSKFSKQTWGWGRKGVKFLCLWLYNMTANVSWPWCKGIITFSKDYWWLCPSRNKEVSSWLCSVGCLETIGLFWQLRDVADWTSQWNYLFVVHSNILSIWTFGWQSCSLKWFLLFAVWTNVGNLNCISHNTIKQETLHWNNCEFALSYELLQMFSFSYVQLVLSLIHI